MKRLIAVLLLVPSLVFAGPNEDLRQAAGCRDGDVDPVADALRAGARINNKDKAGNTALILAVVEGNDDIATLLLAKRADVNARDQHGNTALMLAISKAHDDIAKLLITKRADVQAHDHQGNTALIIAAGQGNGVIVSLLIAALADVNAANKLGQDALHVALLNGNAQSHFGQTALMAAAGNGHVSVVKILLDAKADVHTRNVGHENALNIAMRDAGNPATALLKAAGARETDPIVSKPRATVGLTSPNKQKLYPVEKIQRHQAILKDIQDTDRRIAEIDAELNASTSGASAQNAGSSPTFTRYSCNKTGDKCTANYQGGSAESLQHTPQASWVNDAAERDRRRLLVRRDDLIYYRKQLCREGMALERWFAEN